MVNNIYDCVVLRKIYYLCSAIIKSENVVMAVSIKSIPVLSGQTAINFVAEADSNKNQATPVLSEKAALRLRTVLEKSKAFKF